VGGTNFSAVGGASFKEKGSSQFSGTGSREKRGSENERMYRTKTARNNSCKIRAFFARFFAVCFVHDFWTISPPTAAAPCCCLWSRRGRAALRAGDLLCFRCALYVLPLVLLPWRHVVLRVAPSRAFRPFPMCSHVCSRLGGEWPPRVPPDEAGPGGHEGAARRR